MRLAVEDSQRITLKPSLAVLAQNLSVPAEMLVQRAAPRRAGLRITERVELQDRAPDPQFLKQLVGEGEQLDVGLRLACSDDLGIERLAMMIGTPEAERPSLVIVPLGPRAELEGQQILAGLRREGVAADMGYRGNLKKRLSRANEAGAAYALIIGDDELERGEAQLKDLSSGEQRAVSLDLIAEAIGR